MLEQKKNKKVNSLRAFIMKNPTQSIQFYRQSNPPFVCPQKEEEEGIEPIYGKKKKKDLNFY